MNSITSDNKNFPRYAEIGIVVLLTAAFFGGSMALNFATDTYAAFCDPAGAAVRMFTENGRPVIGLLYLLWDLLPISGEAFYYISYAMAVALVGLSVWLVRAILSPIVREPLTAVILSFLIVANPLIAEYFAFLEKGGFALAIFLSCAAAYFAAGVFSGRKPAARLGISLLLLIAAALTYQGAAALFVVITLPTAFFYSRGGKEYFRRLVTLGAIYALSLGAALLYAKLAGSSRTEISGNVLYGVLRLGYHFLKYLVYGLELMPKFLTGAAVLIAAASNLPVILRLPQKRQRLFALLHLAVLLIFIPLCSMITILFGVGWAAPRIIYPVGALFGALLLHRVLLTEQSETADRNSRAEKGVRVGLRVLVVLWLVCQFACFTRFYIAKYQNDALDKYRIAAVEARIEDYESTSGTEVKYISFYSDGNDSNGAYPLYFHDSGDMVDSSFSTDWSRLAAFNYYTGRDYREAENDPEVAQRFSAEDWSAYSEDQLLFIGDTLHLCLY